MSSTIVSGPWAVNCPNEHGGHSRRWSAKKSFCFSCHSTWRQLMMNVCVTTSVYNHACRGLPRNMGRINLVWSTNSNEQLKKKRLGSQVQNFSLYSRHYQSISINRLLLIIDDQSMKKIFVTLSVVIDCHRLLLIITTQFFTLQIWKFDTFILKTWLFNRTELAENN